MVSTRSPRNPRVRKAVLTGVAHGSGESEGGLESGGFIGALGGRRQSILPCGVGDLQVEEWGWGRDGVEAQLLELELGHAGFEFEKRALERAKRAAEGDAQLRRFLAGGSAESAASALALERRLLDFLARQLFRDFAQVGRDGAGGFERELFIPPIEVVALQDDLRFDVMGSDARLFGGFEGFFLVGERGCHLRLEHIANAAKSGGNQNGHNQPKNNDWLTVKMHEGEISKA